LRALRWPNKSFRDWPDPNKRKWPAQLTDPHGITQPRVLMERFAGVLHEIRRRGFDCVTSVTIQNEVNGAGIDIAKQRDQYLSMRFYELLYRFPVYRVTRLFTHFAPRGWLANGLSRISTAVIASRFAAADGSDQSVLVLNNATRAREQKVQGLRENQDYFVVAWNRDGHGALASLPPLQSDATGAATVQLPAHGIVALSTRNPGI
jgi:hypothetical protein